MAKAVASGTLAVNKRARYDYEILETFEVGLVLSGQEAQSAKRGRAQLTGSFVHLRGGEAWLVNAFIAPYEKASNIDDYDPSRSRKLLLRRRDLRALIGKQQTERMTIVPLRMYMKRNRVKIAMALARGKRQFEKRAAIRKREDTRRIRNAKLR